MDVYSRGYGTSFWPIPKGLGLGPQVANPILKQDFTGRFLRYFWEEIRSLWVYDTHQLIYIHILPWGLKIKLLTSLTPACRHSFCDELLCSCQRKNGDTNTRQQMEHCTCAPNLDILEANMGHATAVCPLVVALHLGCLWSWENCPIFPASCSKFASSITSPAFCPRWASWGHSPTWRIEKSTQSVPVLHRMV